VIELSQQVPKLNRESCLYGVAGYTLIELIAVLALFALLAVLAVPRLTSQHHWHLDAASRRMAADFRLLRHTAIFCGETCRVDFFIHVNRYELRLPDGRQRIDLPREVEFIGNTTFSGTPPALRFNNMGRPSSGGTVILKAGNARRYIIVTPVTGRVRISKNPPQHW
jgi:prepilin-type N-terminal cleavage/methylation domain-containing protein